MLKAVTLSNNVFTVGGVLTVVSIISHAASASSGIASGWDNIQAVRNRTRKGLALLIRVRLSFFSASVASAAAAAAIAAGSFGPSCMSLIIDTSLSIIFRRGRSIRMLLVKTPWSLNFSMRACIALTRMGFSSESIGCFARYLSNSGKSVMSSYTF